LGDKVQSSSLKRREIVQSSMFNVQGSELISKNIEL
jgi:hypothetical protein